MISNQTRTSLFRSSGARSIGLFLAAFLMAEIPAGADLVNLARGIPVQGEILAVDESSVRLRRFDGGTVRLAWDQIAEADRTRLRRQHGLEADDDSAELEIDGVRITMKDGNVLDGLLLKETDTLLDLKQRGKNVLALPRSRVASVERTRISVFSAYTPAELYEKRKSESAPRTAEGHFDLAQYCQKIGAYSPAKDHLALATETDPEYKAAGIRLQIEALDRLVADQKLLSLGETIREQFRSGLYSKVLDGLADLEKRAPGSPVLDALSRSGIMPEKVTARRRGELSRQIGTRWYQLARELCTRKSREDEVTLAIAKAYVGKEMGQEIVSKIAEALAIDAGDVRPLHADRIGVKHVASYGSGTYLVEQKKREGTRPAPSRGGRDGNSGGGGNSRNRNEPQKPNAEEWWKSADLPERRDFLLATYVEATGDFLVMRAEYENCPKCGGRGYVVMYVQGSDNTRFACDRCWQTRTDKRIVFR
jgi:hypothetical protein